MTLQFQIINNPIIAQIAKKRNGKKTQKELIIKKLEVMNGSLLFAFEALRETYAMNVFLMNLLIEDLK